MRPLIAYVFPYNLIAQPFYNCFQRGAWLHLNGFSVKIILRIWFNQVLYCSICSCKITCKHMGNFAEKLNSGKRVLPPSPPPPAETSDYIPGLPPGLYCLPKDFQVSSHIHTSLHLTTLPLQRCPKYSFNGFNVHFGVNNALRNVSFLLRISIWICHLKLRVKGTYKCKLKLNQFFHSSWNIQSYSSTSS